MFEKKNEVSWKIDGVGVADCKYFELGACRLKCYLAQGAIIKDGRCEGFKCYYKQWQQEKTEKEKLVEAISTNLQTFKDVVENAKEDIYFKLLPENPSSIDYCITAIYEARNKIDFLQEELNKKTAEVEECKNALVLSVKRIMNII